MTKAIKSFLYRILNLNTYLKCLHISFCILFDLQILKKDKSYHYHYFVRNLINKGDCVIDIGANLGYFSRIFYRAVGSSGTLISIEPMPPFFNVLKWLFNSKKNIVLHNYALGTENKKTEIFHPHENNSYFRTGLSNIPMETTNKKDTNGITYEIEMRKGSELLENLSKINFIKIDIEGYEEYVIPELYNILNKHKPIILIETWGTHKEVVINNMKKLEYLQYSLNGNKLEKNFDDSAASSDYVFIHKSKAETIIQKLALKNFA